MMCRQGCMWCCGLGVVGPACFLSLPSSGQTAAHLVTSVFLCSLHNLFSDCLGCVFTVPLMRPKSTSPSPRLYP